MTTHPENPGQARPEMVFVDGRASWRIAFFVIYTIVICNVLLRAEELTPSPKFPLWDNSESVADYAERVGLPPTKTLDLGNGVKLELVLIPAGKFMMGTPEPVPVDEDGFHKKIVTGQALLAVGCGVLLVLLGAVAVQALRKRQRPKFSLARLLAMTVAAGIVVLSGLHWSMSAQMMEKAQIEFMSAKTRYSAALAEEKPAHLVTLTKSFYVGKFSVTQEQYQQVVGQNPSDFSGKNNPVECVSWNDAQSFCKKLGEQTEQTIRLPTEAEWEYACRAGTTAKYYSGDTYADLSRVAWYSTNMTHPVGQKSPNAFGLYDMLGNVSQWCEDRYGENYYEMSASEDPQGPALGGGHVLRGGSWADGPLECRATTRYTDRDVWTDKEVQHAPAFNDDWGFRVVVELEPKTP
ncbi:MAG: SUMF1/EgtB/PvdO family nonheme iron enzyme [Planctomycetes bacterium]|nr:SUMF1/EgtB/PvdO family nonheme iron enzyme [Planctomycetota bacterium]